MTPRRRHFALVCAVLAVVSVAPRSDAASVGTEGFVSTFIDTPGSGDPGLIESYSHLGVPAAPVSDSLSFVDPRSGAIRSARGISSVSVDFGSTQVHVTAETLTEDPTKNTLASSSATGTWSDSLSIDAQAATGQQVTAFLAFDVSAVLLSDAFGYSSASYDFFLRSTYLGSFVEFSHGGYWDVAQGTFGGFAPGHLVFAVAYRIGSSLDLSARLSLQAHAQAFISYYDGGDAHVEAESSATFVGLTLVDENGAPISFTATSQSGHDYSGVPEPGAAELLLVAAALSGLVQARRLTAP